MNPIVSVLIPTYNRKNMLKIALESILNQDYPHLEIVVSDNASTDGTEEFVKSYNDTRIKYIKRPENIGAGRNFQEGFKDCTGKYFFCLNDDDFLTNKTYFSKAVQIMQENPNVSLVRAIVVEREHQFKKNRIQSFYASDIVNGLEYFQNFATVGYEGCICWFGFVRREDIVEAGGIYNHYSADTFMNLTSCLYGDVYFLPEVIGQYNRFGENQGTFDPHTLNTYIEIPYIIKKVCEIAQKRHNLTKQQTENTCYYLTTTIIQWTLNLYGTMGKHDIGREVLQKSSIKKDFSTIYDFCMSTLSLPHDQSSAYGIKQSAKFLIQAISLKIRKVLGK